MRAVIQRVRRARVCVAEQEVGAIGKGMVVLLGFGEEESPDVVHSRMWQGFLSKIVNLRIFPGDKGHFDRSLLEVRAGILLVSQFTLFADCKRGRRPSFSAALQPELAQGLFNAFAWDLEQLCPEVATGVFGADMDVELVNWGPVTLTLDSRDLFPGEYQEA
ncbi:D-aminoacyl-tRNA deacylase [Desulfoplanes formicivorans]|uniref:D-aminoacyl-tRNA deacylase n=1 Tax=Desulfoplanes formicivorans TaxID=1592317 RepID=A0A194AFW2_9BACT|nr:D-aminoacyl-tRNA deacylase [Desulfoplanes formicivorans]GAU07971.1 D-tyrosyl-tRNA(Tyr) deacylase [Desulfoplanes formicivorans]